MVDDVVQQRKETVCTSTGADGPKPASLLDLLLMSDVYERDVKRITNDLVMTMIAATETSRNATIFALCQLTKKEEYWAKVRDEIGACIGKYGLSSAEELTHKHTTPQDLEFLSWMINECLRFNPPAPGTE